MKNDPNTARILCIVFLGACMILSILLDGAFGERIFASLMGGFGFMLGYYFTKAQYDSNNKK